MIQTIISIFFTGIGILVIAIILNVIANSFAWMTWYDYINEIQNKGWSQANSSLKAGTFLYLYIFYPFLLGLAAYLIMKILGIR